MRKVMWLIAALAAPALLVGCSAQEGLQPVPAAVVAPGTAPLAIADIAVVETDSQNNSITALDNDIDLSGTGLTITAVLVDQVLPAAAGTVATTNGTTVTFTPPANFTGVVTLQYAIADGTGATSAAVIAISVLPVALPPFALPDVATVLQDSGPTDIDVVANDVDFAGGGLTLTGATVTASLPAAVHTVALVGNQVRFTPAAGFIGAVLVDYTVTDVNGSSAIGVLTVMVSPLDLALGPVPVPDAAVVMQGSTDNDIDVLANDVDPAGGGLTLSAAAVATSLPDAVHTLAIVGNQVRFTPAGGFAGSVVVTYTATDVNGNSADGVLTIVVSPLALSVGPVPLPDVATVTQDSGATDIDVLVNDIDPAGGGLTLTAAATTASLPAAAHTVAIVGNRVRFTPAAGFAGIVVVTYTATDVNGNSADGLLTVMVSPLDLTVGPVTVPDAAVVLQDSGANNIDVLANDVDPAGGGLTLTAVAVAASLPNAVHTVAISGNQVQFTPAAGFAGSVVVTYTATDVNGNSADGVLTIMVSPLALPVGPVTLPDMAVVPQNSGATDIDVLANDVDPAGGGLTLTAAAATDSLPAATHTIAIVGNQVRFTPAVGFAGIVVVTYTATDVNGNSADGLLNIVVSPLDPLLDPVAIPDVAVVMQDSGANDIIVVANDVDPAGGGLTLTSVSITSSLPAAAHTVAIVGNQVRFTPAAGFAGVVVVSYVITDINGNTANGLLGIEVSPLALVLGPVAAPDTAVVSSLGGAVLIDVLANDIDPAAGGLTLTAVSIDVEVPAVSGSVAIVGNQVQYTPTLGYIGSVLVRYTATDVNGNTTIGELSLTVVL
jgi:hypothetical protein